MSFVSPLDLLSATADEQDVIRCLVRRPLLTAREIASFTQIPSQELNSLLDKMVRNDRLIRDKEEKFQVLLDGPKRTRKKQSGRSLLDSLFD